MQIANNTVQVRSTGTCYGRTVAIYLRDGVVSVADFKGRFGRILTVGEWGVFHARKLAHAQRRRDEAPALPG